MISRASDDGSGNLLRIIATGPLCLVQDSGRTGFQKLGVSVSGAADIDALNAANRLVGNDPKAAAIEILLGGAEFEFVQTTVFALTGAETGASLDGVPLGRNISYSAHPSAQLILGMAGPGQGLRAYLAVAGGIETPRVLGSRSTHVASGLGGVDGRALTAGDSLPIGEPATVVTSGYESNVAGPASTSQEFSETPALRVRVVLGPQDDNFSETGIRTFLKATYVVTDQSDRQGLRLDGPEIESRTGRYDIVSDAVVNGSIQVPGDGKPIVLLADRQSTGGYAKIATVASVDLPKLGQAPPGASITFSAISVEEAQELLAARSKDLRESEPGPVVGQFSVRVDDQDVSVGVVENESAQPAGATHIARIARINGAAYPISVERYTPAE